MLLGDHILPLTPTKHPLTAEQNQGLSYILIHPITHSLTQGLSSCWVGETDLEKLRNLPHITRPADPTLMHIFFSLHHSAYHWGFVLLQLQHFYHFCCLFFLCPSLNTGVSILALILLIYTPCVISCTAKVFTYHAHRWFPNLSIKLRSLF